MRQIHLPSKNLLNAYQPLNIEYCFSEPYDLWIKALRSSEPLITRWVAQTPQFDVCANIVVGVQQELVEDCDEQSQFFGTRRLMQI